VGLVGSAYEQIYNRIVHKWTVDGGT
jgi:hypothetical protein